MLRKVRAALAGSSGAADPALCGDNALWGSMDDSARVGCVLRFCRELAACPAAVEVRPDLSISARLHRQLRVGDVLSLQLGALPVTHNAALLAAAPVRMESAQRADAL
eukprot:gene21313-42792_t